MSEHTDPARDVEALGKVIWAASRADEGTISATGADVVARIILASDWLAAYAAAKQAETLREAAAQWVDGGIITTDKLRRFLRDRADRIDGGA